MALSSGETVQIRLDEESAVGEVRRTARRLATNAGLDESAAERAAIVASEVGRNVVRHGRGGFVTLREIAGPPPGLEILAVDRGPGIPDVAAAMRDGHSTAGTPGQGLGAVRRLATAFDLWSAPDQGTALLAEIRTAPAPALPIAGIAVPRPGEDVCGDVWVVVGDAHRTVLAMLDGLGHGPLAREAAQVGADAIRRHAGLGPTDLLGLVHDALRSTRGAAVAVLEARDGEPVRFAGVGNVSAAIVAPAGVRRLVSLSGTLGHEMRRIQEFAYDWPPGALLVMHSDGLATHWALDAYAGLTLRAPALVAGVLLRDFQRGRDDATVLVARREHP